LEGNSPPIKV